ncbi:MAG: Hpt domain-containing protein [Cytophagales bacterium]
MKLKVLDYNHLNECFSGDQNTIVDFLHIFQTSTTKDLSSLIEAIEEENGDTTKKVAHKLKSAYRYLCIENLGEILEKIEKSGKMNLNKIELKLLFEKGLEINKELTNDINQILTENE